MTNLTECGIYNLQLGRNLTTASITKGGREVAEEKKMMRSDEELENIALELFKTLKPMRLTVLEIFSVVKHMEKLIRYVTYR